jgi:kynureninase
VYLDGNSLGPLPAGVAERVARVVEEEWGRSLIRGWNDHGWVDLPARVGDRIARLVGAAPGTVVATDSTSINVAKALAAALRCSPDRRVVLSDDGNFPTDLYVAQGLLARWAPATSCDSSPPTEVEAVLGRPDGRGCRGADADPRRLPHRSDARHGAR